MSLANESKPDRKAVIVLTCCALQSACYSPTGIVILFILAQFQGEVQTNLTVKRFLMCSAAGKYPLSLLPLVAASSPKGTPYGYAAKFPATAKAVPLGKVA